MNPTVLITGASSGIGKATAKAFAADGWNVIATMRNPQLEKDLTGIANICIARLDVEIEETIQTTIAESIGKYGQIDVLINNAGQGLFGVFEATPSERIHRLFEVNLFGVLKVTRAVLPHFRERRTGTIINVSSSTARFALPLMSAYCASKYALEGFSESLSYELSAQNIKVKLIEPGMVETNFDETTRKNYIADPTVTGYEDYLDKMISIFSQQDPAERKVTAEEAATVIYHAATDKSDRLRYIIGDDVKAMIAGRESMSDEDYMNMMHKRFSIQYY